MLRTLGAEYVIDSRSLSAIDEVRTLTGGHGADVVVNAAPGEAVLANLEVAAEFGRVVEVGKTEIFGGRLIDLAVFNKNLSLISIDLDRMMVHRMDLLLQIHSEVLALILAGKYELLPTRILPVSQLADAFEQVARSTHLGRIVLDFTESAPPVKPARPVTSIRSDAAYLVTGGLGAFGLATARWLAAKGAGTIVLAGRRGAASADQQAAVEAMRASGADVRVEQVDVADRASVDALLARLSDSPPLRGVFHAAGVLADEPLGQLSHHGLNAVLSPKARGAFVLSEALAETDLDHFVLYSSVTSQSRDRPADQLCSGERRAGHAGPPPGEPGTTGAVGELGIARRRHGRLQQGDLDLLGPERPTSAAPGRCMRVPGRGDRPEADPSGDRRHQLGDCGRRCTRRRQAPRDSPGHFNAAKGTSAASRLRARRTRRDGSRAASRGAHPDAGRTGGRGSRYPRRLSRLSHSAARTGVGLAAGGRVTRSGQRRPGRGDLRAGTEPQRRAVLACLEARRPARSGPMSRRSGSGATATTFHREDPPRRPTV